jgi:membrane-bound lytic murein transglycosylase D
MIESGFDTTAVSRAGAVGLWQFMPRTGRARGLVVTRRYDERRDPERATEAAVLHLTRLYDRFQSWPLAMAAYNAGSGHVRGEIRRFSVNDFWSMDDYGAIYDDTRRYVHKIIAAAIIGENPERFGFEGIVGEGPIAYETVTVSGETSLRTLARAIDTEVDTLLELNPSLRVARLPEVDAFDLHIPAGSLPEFLEEVDGIDPDDAPTTLCRLRFGETVESLAGVLRIPERAIRHYNGLERREPVPYGTELVVPLDATTVSDAIRASMGRRTSEEPPLVITPELEVRPPRAQRVFYQVQRGDLLDEVAAAFGVSVYQLAMWNDLDPEAALHSDMVLQVWLRHDVDVATALADTRFLLEEEVNAMALGSPEFLAWQEEQERERRSRRREYTVRRGDTVSEIARRFGVRPSDIVRWNRLDSANHIRTGQVLRIR